MGEYELNEATKSLNGRQTRCDTCHRKEQCFKENRLYIFNLISDVGNIKEYGYKGAHGMILDEQLCPLKKGE